MPQARSAGSSTNKPAAKRASPRSSAAKPAAAKSAAAAKPAAAKSAAAKPAAAKRTNARSAAAKPAAARSANAGRADSTKTTAAKNTAAKSAAAKSSTAAKPSAAAKGRPRVTIHVNTEGTQVEAIAERVRKLNEKIIEVGREAGESTLANYEKTLKTIASGISKSPAKDELEWIQQLAASQAKFVRDITESWAKAARERLK